MVPTWLFRLAEGATIQAFDQDFRNDFDRGVDRDVDEAGDDDFHRSWRRRNAISKKIGFLMLFQ